MKKEPPKMSQDKIDKRASALRENLLRRKMKAKAGKTGEKTLHSNDSDRNCE